MCRSEFAIAFVGAVRDVSWPGRITKEMSVRTPVRHNAMANDYRAASLCGSDLLPSLTGMSAVGCHEFGNFAVIGSRTYGVRSRSQTPQATENSYLLQPSPTFSNLLPPSPTLSNLLQPSPTFPTDFWSQGCRSQGALGDCQLCQEAVSPRREPGAKEP